MEKLKMQTENLADRNFETLSKLFPNAVTETIDEATGEVVRAIDADVLRQEISTAVVEGREERYQFTWPDKKQAVLLANTPINKTLRPVREKSVGRDGTEGGFDSENIYIEGDNLDVLKLLRNTYLGKVKMIYIDPPYNTGNDFVYADDFAQSMDEYMDHSGQFDEEGNRLVQNTESNGRYHTDWLNMIYPRLRVARDLLREDGVIFISIDENEKANCEKICDEIFGALNKIATICWKRKKEISNDSKNVAIQGEYLIVYAKSAMATLSLEPVSKEYIEKSYNEPNEQFTRGKWRPVPITVSKGLSGGGYTYEIITPSGVKHTRVWAYPEKSYRKLVEDNRIYYGKDNSGIPQRVMYADESKGQPISNYWDNVASNKEGKKEILNLFGDNFFDTPKPVGLIQKILNVTAEDDSIIVDFFSGSATSAQAVMEKNAENGGHIKHILVQLPEPTYEVEEEIVVDDNGEEQEIYKIDQETGYPVIKKDSEARKAGFWTICDIGEERIRRAGKRIKEETGANIDYGFRVFKLDSSNMKDIYYRPEEVEQLSFTTKVDNIKSGRSPEDLLFQVMLDMGIVLSESITEEEIDGKKVFNVGDGFLIACFDENVTDETVKAIAQKKPRYAVFRDSSMANDSVMANFDQIFETYSKETVRKVL